MRLFKKNPAIEIVDAPELGPYQKTYPVKRNTDIHQEARVIGGDKQDKFIDDIVSNKERQHAGEKCKDNVRSKQIKGSKEEIAARNYQ
ncbi:MAG: hypothetical protein HC836_32785 [Richelia sp. RM2_1_2]|nr:hypothetical protein [Richelia sp. RM2_1_2]